MDAGVLEDVAGQIMPASLLAGLKARYAEPHRRYHTWPHIEQLFTEYRSVAGQIVHHQAVLYALLYHDAVYAVPSSTNEEDSAVLMLDELGPHAAPVLLDLAARIIRATRHHLVEDVAPGAQAHDCSLFLDMDMSILGADEERYHIYAAQIREEYAVVPDAAYKAGRARILTEFLDRPRLYFSAHYFERLETRARANILKELQALQ